MVVGLPLTFFIILNEAVFKHTNSVINFLVNFFSIGFILAIFWFEIKAGLKSFKILGRRAWIGGAVTFFLFPFFVFIFCLYKTNFFEIESLNIPIKHILAFVYIGLLFGTPLFIGSVLSSLKYKNIQDK